MDYISDERYVSFFDSLEEEERRIMERGSVGPDGLSLHIPRQRRKLTLK